MEARFLESQGHKLFLDAWNIGDHLESVLPAMTGEELRGTSLSERKVLSKRVG